MNILGTGLSGLVGSRIVELLKDKHTFENLSLETGVDITDYKGLYDRIIASSALWVWHFAAKTDVDGCEKEKYLGEKSEAWRVNVTATENITKLCKKTGKQLLYLSTDFVFDGTKNVYREEDIPNPQSWYAKTKYEAEKRVMQLGQKGLIVRIAYPYRAHIGKKPDFVHKMLSLLQSGAEVSAPQDQQKTPTFIDDIALGLFCLTSINATGVYHIVGSGWVSPFDAAKKIAATFDIKDPHIKPVSFREYNKGRAPRPLHAYLANDKITKLGIKMSSLDEGLEKVKTQLGKLV